MWQSLHDVWWRLATKNHPRTISENLVCGILHSLSVAYGACVAMRNATYDRGFVKQVKLPCRVISVGNLTVGGTGKTACVEFVAEKLLKLGKQIAILSRGYGGASKNYWLKGKEGELTVSEDQVAGIEGLADEPRLLARHLDGVPVIVGAKRARSGNLAYTKFGADTVILDDGFQHRHVARDCEIVLIHARMPFGGWHVLPRGPMREPIESVKRADVIIVTKADEALETVAAYTERLRKLNPSAAIVTAVHELEYLLDAITGERYDPERLGGLRVMLVSSIGDPGSFEMTMRRFDATIDSHASFPDHFHYRPVDWESILSKSKAVRPDAIITTEKDWMRLSRLIRKTPPSGIPLWVVRVRMKLLSGEDHLDDRLAGIYAR